MKPDSGRLDLERLQSTDAPELYRALEAVKQQLPDPKQLAALAASLTQLGVPVAPSSHATTATTSSATRLKLLLAAGVVGPLTLALLVWRSTQPHTVSPTPVASPATPAAQVAVEVPQQIPEGSSGVSKQPASSTASGVLPSGPPLPSSKAIDAAASSQEPQSAPSPEPLKSAARVATAPRASVEGVRSPLPLVTDRASHESVGQGVVARPTEVALLRDARLALGSDPAQAFALAEQHRVLFAHGAMVQERELIAISALARMGRHSAVLARAAQFEHDFPNSPYRKQVSALAQ